jgi:hypothetical protein
MVMLPGRRYIVCSNPQEAEKDAGDRTSTVAALERQLAEGRQGADRQHRSMPTRSRRSMGMTVGFFDHPQECP